MFDCHVHTSFSTDCNMKIEEAIKSSREKGISLVITEHMDLNFPRSGEFIFNTEKYFIEYEKYRGNELLLGIEMGMRPDCIGENRELSNEKFDLVIGSVHVVDAMDVYEGDLYEGRDKKEAFEHYLKYMLSCLKDYSFIDTLGHIDYISRYAHYLDREIYYNDYADLIDEILKELALKEKSIEINTRRFTDKKAVENLFRIYKRFYELGGKTVTIGSDSHSPAYVGSNLKMAYDMAEKCDLKPVYYRERKIQYV